MRLFFEITPVAKGRPRMTRGGHVYTPAKTKMFEQALKVLAKNQYIGMPFQGPIGVKIFIGIPKPKSVDRVYPHVKPDIDNYVKSICDALNQIVWVDDSQIIDLQVTKRYSNGHGQLVVDVNRVRES